MKFIRDIVDSQQRHLEKDAREDNTSRHASTPAHVATDVVQEQDDAFMLSSQPTTQDAFVITEDLHPSDQEGDVGIQSSLQAGFGEDIGRLDEGEPADLDCRSPQSPEVKSSASAVEAMSVFSPSRPEVDSEEQVSRHSQVPPSARTKNASQPYVLNAADELPLPLRERPSARETVVSQADPVSEQAMTPQTALRDDPVRDQYVEVPAPEVGRASNRGSRAKTRLLGFHPAAARTDPMSRLGNGTVAQSAQFPVGWLVVISGPGRGTQFTIEAGVAQIGRAEGQKIRLDFGDSSISRENHAAIAYDSEQNAFFVGHGGKANLVRRNDRPVLSTEELVAGDRIRVGETTLRFVPLCGADFSWDQPQQPSRNHAIRG